MKDQRRVVNRISAKKWASLIALCSTSAFLAQIQEVAWAGPCEDVEEYRRARSEASSAEQKLVALERSKPAGHWSGLQNQLIKASDAAQQTKTKLEQAQASKRAADQEVEAFIIVSGWILSPAGSADENRYRNQIPNLKLPVAASSQVRQAQALRDGIASLDREITLGRTVLNNADKKKQQGLVDYERQQIMPLETSLRSRMPNVPLDQLAEKAADPQYNDFKTPELDALWKEYENANAQLGQSTVFNVEEENKRKVRALERKLKDAVEAYRKVVQDDIDELDGRRTTLRSMNYDVYGGEENYERVVSLTANRKRKEEKEKELATVRQSLLNGHQAALKKSDDADARVLTLQQEQRNARNRITQLEGELKSWRQAEKERYLAQRRVENKRDLAEEALRGEAAALGRAVALIKTPLAEYKANTPASHEAELQQLRTQHKQIVTQARTTRDSLQSQINGLKARRAYTESEKTRIVGQWTRYLAAARQKDSQIKKRYTELVGLRRQQPELQRQRGQKLLAALKQAKNEIAPYDCASFPDSQQSLQTIQERIDELEVKLRPVGKPLPSTTLVTGFMALPELYSPPTDTVNKPRVVKAPPKPAQSEWLERTYNVSATQWHSTGIVLKKDEFFKVEATGKISTADGFECGPDGGGYWRWWILHGKIGDKIFPIGSGGWEYAPADGTLELGIPRAGGKILPEDNGFRGAYVVKVSVKR